MCHTHAAMRTTAILLLGFTSSLLAALADSARVNSEGKHDVTDPPHSDLLMAKFEQMEREMLALKEEMTQLKMTIKKGLYAQPTPIAFFTLAGAYYPTDCTDISNSFRAYDAPSPGGYYMVQTNASETSRKFVLCD